MDTALFEPFLSSTLEMVEMMTGLEGKAGDSIGGIIEADVSASIQISGQMSGQLTIAFPNDVALSLLSMMLGLEPEELDREMIGDGVGEMVNIVAGQAKGEIETEGEAFNLSIPVIVAGPHHTVELFKGNRIGAQKINTEVGAFALALWLERVDLAG